MGKFFNQNVMNSNRKPTESMRVRFNQDSRPTTPIAKVVVEAEQPKPIQHFVSDKFAKSAAARLNIAKARAARAARAAKIAEREKLNA